MQALPGVEASSFAVTSPMGWVWLGAGIEGPDASRRSIGEVHAGTNAVSPRYFEVMGIDVMDGRAFTDADDEQAPRVAVVNERFAATIWPGQNPLERRFAAAASGTRNAPAARVAVPPGSAALTDDVDGGAASSAFTA